MSDDDVQSLVVPEQILAALRTKHGPRVRRLQKLEVSRATANVLGITSLILRVRVIFTNAEDYICQDETDSLVVKRLPLCQKQLELVDNCNSFEREIEYLTEYVPILKERAKGRNLPFVDCFFGAERTLVMEDLCASGYQSLISTIGDLKKDVFTLDHVEAVFKALAEVHAASVGIDWEERFPRYLPHNALLDGKDGEFFKATLDSAIDGLLFLTDEPLKETHRDVVKWLKEGDIFGELRKFGKRSDQFLSVLNHGDPWGNNILFRKNEQTGQLELKMVDYQLGKFAPAVCDLHYFLYTSTSYKFRKCHELTLFQFYVREFNSLIADEFQLNWQDFEGFYHKSRIHGLVFATLCRPMLHMHKRTPSSEMSDEKFMEFMVRDYKGHEHNQMLRNEVMDIFLDFVEYFHFSRRSDFNN